jgi:uncharacterized membrane-anchored protein YjiN (DUF445 family)
MEERNLLKMVQDKLAVSMVESLSEEERKEIIAEAISDRLSRMSADWKVEQLLEAEVLQYAAEYAQKPEVKERLKQKAVEAVNDVIEGIHILVGKALEDYIKSNYERILSKKKYGE